MDKILTANFDQLRTKFDNALETRQRVEGDTFVRDIQMFKFVSRGYMRMRRFAREYLGEEDSLFPRVVSAVQNMVSVFQDDLYRLLGNVKSFIKAYDFYYLDTRNLYNAFSGELRRSLSEVDQLLYLTVRSGKVHRYLGEVSKDALRQAQFLKETIDLMAMKRKNTTFAAESYHEKELARWLPKRFTTNTDACELYSRNMANVLDRLKKLVGSTSTYANQGRASSLSNIQGEFRRGYTDYKETDEHVKRCLEEYMDVLKTVKTGMEQFNASAYEIRHREILVYNYTQEIDIIYQDNIALDSAVKDYEHGGKMKKRDILEIFIPSESPNEKATNITKFAGRVKSRISDTLRQYIQETALHLKVKHNL